MVQIFTGFGTFILLRGMANLPVPGLEHGGLLWFHNLTVPDPFLILPLATSAVLHWVLRVRFPLISLKTQLTNRSVEAKQAPPPCPPKL